MSPQRAATLIQRFAGKKILVVGDIMLDHYLHGVVERVNPEAPVPVIRAQTEHDMTGGAGNTAKNAASLGARTTLLGVVGCDAAAVRVKELARQEGYAIAAIADPSRPTTCKTRYYASNQQLLRVDHEQTHDLSPDIAAALIAALKKAGAGMDGIIVSDYAKGVITEQVAAAVLELSERFHSLVAADVKPSRAEYFTDATFIAPNLKEAHEFLGCNPAQGTRPMRALAKQLREKMRAEVFITLGADGMFVQAEGCDGRHVPQPHVVEVADVSGAGDTATVVLLLARLAGASAPEAAELANAAGAVVVSKLGSASLSPEELQAMVAQTQP